MAKTRAVLLKDFTDIREEFVAASTVSPCHIVEVTSAGKVQAHATAGGNITPVMVALEDSMQGNDIDDDYAAGAIVNCAVLRPGDRFQAILKDGESVSIGDELESAGDGTLQAHVVDSTGVYYHNSVKFIAMEAKDMSGSSGVDPTPYMDVMVIA